MTELVITDHALVRYLERHVGLDFKSYRAEITAKCKTAALAGAAHLEIDGLRFVFGRENETGRIRVKTILTADMATHYHRPVLEKNQLWEQRLKEDLRKSRRDRTHTKIRKSKSGGRK